jgi:aconitate hydratase
MHDTTCVPALVDVAAMRSALAEAGGDPTLLNPVLPVDVSVDHSVAVDHYGSPDALARNMERELGRNLERYRFMKWATRALKDLRVHPPGTGIMHTINLERLATIVTTETRDGETWAIPDTLIGTDSHTPMINGIGVLAWGVGGVEAESVLFGMPVMLRIPEVIGVGLLGRLPDGTLATDLALTVTEQLRRLGLSGQFVEFFGPGLSSLSAGDRAVVANMAPEYGASSGFFPVDEQTLAYLIATGRSRSQADLVATYAKRQSLWFDPDATPRYTDTVEIDLGRIGVTLAGPRRPQDRLSPAQTVEALAGLWDVPLRPAGPDASEPSDGAVAIAAITSCTSTSNPRMTVALPAADSARRWGSREQRRSSPRASA